MKGFALRPHLGIGRRSGRKLVGLFFGRFSSTLGYWKAVCPEISGSVFLPMFAQTWVLECSLAGN